MRMWRRSRVHPMTSGTLLDAHGLATMAADALGTLADGCGLRHLGGVGVADAPCDRHRATVVGPRHHLGIRVRAVRHRVWSDDDQSPWSVARAAAAHFVARPSV